MRQFNTLTGFLLSKSSAPTTSDTVTFQGYAAIGDGGGATWQHNGVTGQTASQSPAQLADALLNDASGNQWALVADGLPVSPRAFGVIGDGVADDTLAHAAAIAFSGQLDNSGIVTSLVTSTVDFSESNPSPKITGATATLFEVENEEDKFISGDFTGPAGNTFTMLFGTNDGVFVKSCIVKSTSFSLLLKPSLLTGGYAQNMQISSNIVAGTTINTDVGISIDGDTKNTVVSNNIIKNIQRNDDARPGHAMAVAGNDGDIPVNDCTNLVHALNCVYDIDGTINTTGSSDRAKIFDNGALIISEDNVVIISEKNDAVLETEYLEWHGDKDQFITDHFVTITRSNGDIITGYGMVADLAIRFVTIDKNAKGSFIENQD